MHKNKPNLHKLIWSSAQTPLCQLLRCDRQHAIHRTEKTPIFLTPKQLQHTEKLEANYPSAVSGHCSWATHLTKTSHPRWRCSSLLNPRSFTPQWRKSPCLGDSNMYMEDVWLYLKMNTCLVLYKRVLYMLSEVSCTIYRYPYKDVYHVYWQSYIVYTTPKTNMEPQNEPLEEEILLKTNFQVPCWISVG